MPILLESLIKMILGGTGKGFETIGTETATSIPQLIMFNAVKQGKKDITLTRHSLGRETAFPLYIGLLIYNKIRQHNLFDALYQKGLSVSY